MKEKKLPHSFHAKRREFRESLSKSRFNRIFSSATERDVALFFAKLVGSHTRLPFCDTLARSFLRFPSPQSVAHTHTHAYAHMRRHNTRTRVCWTRTAHAVRDSINKCVFAGSLSNLP